jgi:hypothetical protein
MGSGSETTSELIANYCNSVLLIHQSQEDSKEDSEEDGAEEWRNRISNPAIKFSDLVNEDRTSLTTATMSIKELCQSAKSGNREQCGGSDKEEVDEPTFPIGEAVSRFEAYKGYLRFYKTDDNT